MSNQVLVVKLVSLLLNFIVSLFKQKGDKDKMIRSKLEEVTKISNLYHVRREVIDDLIAFRKVKADGVASLMMEIFSVFIMDEKALKEFWTKTVQEMIDGGIVFLDEDIDYIITTFTSRLDRQFKITDSDCANWMCREIKEDFNQ